MLDPFKALALAIIALFMIVFLLECMSTDIVSTVVYAIPYLIVMFCLISFAELLVPPLRRAVFLLAAVIAAFIVVNLLKAVMCS